MTKKSVCQGRFIIDREIADTLQGFIYIGYDTHNNNDTIILKEAKKSLVIDKTSKCGHNINENIINERRIQEHLSSLNDCDNSITKCIAIWDDDTSYWIALEKCDNELFKYIQISFSDDNECGKLIKYFQSKQQICAKKPSKWIKNIKIIFNQMCYGTYYMHKNNVCHNDISCENTMINISKNGDIQAKLIDFGLSKMFYHNNFKLKRKLGKECYMSPECYMGKEYDARSNDIYCLGVCLFRMLVGSPPYTKPELSDEYFRKIINGYLHHMLIQWKRLPLLTNNAVDILEQILAYEKDRIKMDELLKHPFLNLDNNDTLNDDDNDVNNILSDNDYKEDTKYDEKTDYDDIESLGGLDSLSGLDNDDDGLCCAHDCNDDILNKMREREELIRNKLINQSDNELNESNDTQNDEDLTHDSNITNNIKITTDEDITIYKPLKRLAKIKLQDWGLIKYEINFVKNGYIKLGQFSELTQEILVNQLEIPNNDSILFIQKYRHFMGAI